MNYINDKEPSLTYVLESWKKVELNMRLVSGNREVIVLKAAKHVFSAVYRT